MLLFVLVFLYNTRPFFIGMYARTQFMERYEGGDTDFLEKVGVMRERKKLVCHLFSGFSMRPKMRLGKVFLFTVRT